MESGQSPNEPRGSLASSVSGPLTESNTVPLANNDMLNNPATAEVASTLTQHDDGLHGNGQGAAIPDNDMDLHYSVIGVGDINASVLQDSVAIDCPSDENQRYLDEVLGTSRTEQWFNGDIR